MNFTSRSPATPHLSTTPIQVLNNYNRESELSRYMKRRNANSNARGPPAPLRQLTNGRREHENARLCSRTDFSSGACAKSAQKLNPVDRFATQKAQYDADIMTYRPIYNTTANVGPQSFINPLYDAGIAADIDENIRRYDGPI